MRYLIALPLMSLLVSSACLAQPETPPAGREAGSRSGARMREMLERSIERHAAELEQMKEAVARLEKGESPAEVRESLKGIVLENLQQRAEQWRDLRRMRREGGPGDGAPPEGDGLDEEFGGAAFPARRPGIAGPGAGRPVERIMGVLKETNPRMFERLSRMREDDPAEFRRVLDEFAPRLMRLAEERERFPERWPERLRLMSLQHSAQMAAREATIGPEGERAAAKDRLRSILNEQFDIRMRFAEEDIAREEKRLAERRAHVQSMSEDRAGSIERHMTEMLERRPPNGPPPIEEPGDPAPPSRGSDPDSR